MTGILTNLFFLIISLAVFLYLMWIMVPSIAGLPWIPTQTQRIIRALDLARLKPGEKLYDLGAGDGRVLILAAQKYGAHAIGVELSPLHCLVTWINVLTHGVWRNVNIKWASFYKVNFSDANVIFVYLTSKEATRLRLPLEQQLKQGARVITVSCEIPGWRPNHFDQEYLLYLYEIPQKNDEKAGFT